MLHVPQNATNLNQFQTGTAILPPADKSDKDAWKDYLKAKDDVAAQIRTNPKLPANAKAIGVYLLANLNNGSAKRPDDVGKTWKAYHTIAEENGVHELTAKRAVKALVEQGHFFKEEGGFDGKTSNRYTPILKDDSGVTVQIPQEAGVTAAIPQGYQGRNPRGITPDTRLSEVPTDQTPKRATEQEDVITSSYPYTSESAALSIGTPALVAEPAAATSDVVELPDSDRDIQLWDWLTAMAREAPARDEPEPDGDHIVGQPLTTDPLLQSYFGESENPAPAPMVPTAPVRDQRVIPDEYAGAPSRPRSWSPSHESRRW